VRPNGDFRQAGDGGLIRTATAPAQRGVGGCAPHPAGDHPAPQLDRRPGTPLRRWRSPAAGLWRLLGAGPGNTAGHKALNPRGRSRSVGPLAVGAEPLAVARLESNNLDAALQWDGLRRGGQWASRPVGYRHALRGLCGQLPARPLACPGAAGRPGRRPVRPGSATAPKPPRRGDHPRPAARWLPAAAEPRWLSRPGGRSWLNGRLTTLHAARTSWACRRPGGECPGPCDTLPPSGPRFTPGKTCCCRPWPGALGARHLAPSCWRHTCSSYMAWRRLSPGPLRQRQHTPGLPLLGQGRPSGRRCLILTRRWQRECVRRGQNGAAAPAPAGSDQALTVMQQSQGGGLVEAAGRPTAARPCTDHAPVSGCLATWAKCSPPGELTVELDGEDDCGPLPVSWALLARWLLQQPGASTGRPLGDGWSAGWCGFQTAQAQQPELLKSC